MTDRVLATPVAAPAPGHPYRANATGISQLNQPLPDVVVRPILGSPRQSSARQHRGTPLSTSRSARR
jgi:hypothetical protein